MPINYQGNVSPESKMRAPDRVFKLELIDTKKPITATGMVDQRLFKGDDATRLHCVMDLETSLWSFKYSRGAIPPGLEGRWTSFKTAKDHADKYFVNRNLRITQVED
jgi:hypothetical protein